MQGALNCSPPLIRIAANASAHHLPQVFISGEIHGDERVGPVASLAAAQLLVWAAHCRVARSEAHCALLDRRFPGLSAADRNWLAYLATHRDVLVAPALNCLGHMQRRREEGAVDPNRDFPYSRRDGRCFQSVTARLVRRIMQGPALVVLVVTFHAGMQALGFEWGSRNHPAPADGSPDETANAAVASVLTRAAGRPLYPTGRMNSLVYPVDGAMEDWLYAAGWDSSTAVRACVGDPDPVPAHPNNNAALVFLVETSDDKAPRYLGESNGSLTTSSGVQQQQHVPRNVRLALAAVDLTEPYVCLHGLGASEVVWYVGGAHSVDTTFLTLSRAPEEVLPSDEQLDGLLGRRGEPRAEADDLQLVSALLSGGSRWADTEAEGRASIAVPAQLFRHALRTPEEVLREGQRFVVRAWAAVDAPYAVPDQGQPAGAPKSHYVALRTSSGVRTPSEVAGRRYWSSAPIVIMRGNGTATSSVVLRAPLHCVDWSTSSAVHRHADTHVVANTSSGVQEVQGVEAAERVYLLGCLALLLLGAAGGGLAGCVWRLLRRQRVYSSVASNRYLSLPTGFQQV